MNDFNSLILDINQLIYKIMKDHNELVSDVSGNYYDINFLTFPLGNQDIPSNRPKDKKPELILV